MEAPVAQPLFEPLQRRHVRTRSSAVAGLEGPGSGSQPLQLQSRSAAAPPALEHRSVLQAHRKRVVPPLPRALSSLRRALPIFREDDSAQPFEADLFPLFSKQLPLLLEVPGAEEVSKSQVASASAGSSVTGGSAGSSARSGSWAASSDGAATGASASAAGVRFSAASSESTAARSCGVPPSVSELGASPVNPLRVGVLCCGVKSSLPPHPVNVVSGLIAYLSVASPGSRILGFQDGPLGFLDGRCRELCAEEVASFLNQCAVELLGYSCFTETAEGCQQKDPFSQAGISRAAAVCNDQRLDGLVVIAGPKNLSWAAALASGFLQEGCQTTVVGVPYSKNLNLYVPKYIPITLGFDSGRRMLSEVVGSIAVDAISSQKYWHFIRSGEDALTMEVALNTRCNFTVFATTREGKPVTMQETVDRLVKGVQRRREIGRPSGVVLVSGSFLADLPEMAVLKAELLQLCGDVVHGKPPALEEVERQLKDEGAKTLFSRLPRAAQMSLIKERDASGKPALPPEVEAERILGRFVQQDSKDPSGKHGLAPRFHAVELMGNAPFPSNFDCAFGYTLGHAAAALVCERRTFHVASCADMHLPVEDWKPCAVPFSALYHNPEGSSECKIIPRIGRLRRRRIAEAHSYFREKWVECNAVRAPGPVQFGDDGHVGPMSERPLVLLAEYLSLDELKQLIQPADELPSPLTISPSPLFVRDVRVHANLSAVEQARVAYQPTLPEYLRGGVLAQNEEITPQACDSAKKLDVALPLSKGRSAVRFLPFESSSCRKASQEQMHKAPSCGAFTPSPRASLSKQLRVGVVFSSSQAPGFHTVVAGLFDYLSGLEPPAELIGFLGGYDGLVKGHSTTITQEMVDEYRNLGGQDMLCQFGVPASLHMKDHLCAATETVAQLQLDGLVLVGRLASHVDSAFIDEACMARHLGTKVVGVPVSLDNDFPFVQQTIGYDTASRTLISFIGDIGKLAEHTGNQWIFVRITGDATANLAVESAMMAQPHLVMLAGGQLLGQRIELIVKAVCDLIVKRHEEGNNYGVVLLPMGFVMDILEMRQLFREIMEIMASESYETGWSSIRHIAAKLKTSTAALFEVFPRDVQYEICFGGRERSTNKIDLTSISTDRLLLRFVQIELQRRRRLGLIAEDFFRGTCYPMLHQARSAIPTNFDCDLAYTLGWGAAMLVGLGKGGQLVHAAHLECSVDEWRVAGIPLTSLISVDIVEETSQHDIRPSPFHLLKQRSVVRPFSSLLPPKDRVAVYHGPVQFYGRVALDPSLRRTWYMLNFPVQDPMEKMREIAGLCSELQSAMASAKQESTLYAVNNLLKNAISVLDSYKKLSGDASHKQKQSLAEIPIEQMPQVWRTKIRHPPAARVRSPSPHELCAGAGRLSGHSKSPILGPTSPSSGRPGRASEAGLKWPSGPGKEQMDESAWQI